MSSELRPKITLAMKEAMKSKDSKTLATVRLIMAALKDRDIAARGQGKDDGLDDTEILGLLQTMVKQRKESIRMYTEGGRPELAEGEQSEIGVIERFMPTQMSDDEISVALVAAIEQTNAQSIKDMGKVMGVLKSKHAGVIDMSKASQMIKDKLAS